MFDNLSVMIESVNSLKNEWRELCNNIMALADFLEHDSNEGLEIIRALLISYGGIQEEIFSKITNVKIAEICRDVGSTLQTNGRRPKYLLGMRIQNKLIIFVYHSITNEIEELEAKIPELTDDLAGILIREIWIKNSIHNYAKEKNAIVIENATTFLCK